MAATARLTRAERSAQTQRLALERLIDPDQVPGNLMAGVQARLLATQR